LTKGKCRGSSAGNQEDEKEEEFVTHVKESGKEDFSLPLRVAPPQSFGEEEKRHS